MRAEAIIALYVACFAFGWAWCSAMFTEIGYRQWKRQRADIECRASEIQRDFEETSASIRRGARRTDRRFKL